MGWRDDSPHPNGRAAKLRRHEQLTRAATTFAGTRIGVVCKQARGRKVLDVGCVSHNFGVATSNTGGWLHKFMVEVAAECVGVDFDKAGVEAMRAAGYDVLHADITGDLTPILDRGPFDVVVAGEVIEHLPAPQALLEMAREVLRPGGRLVLTTPNPYSPRRQRTGALGITWENVDHIVYAFPSGIAELADRTGLRLEKYGSVGWPADAPLWADLRDSIRPLIKAARARAKGRRDPLSPTRLGLPLPVRWLSPLDIVVLRTRGRRRMLRETAVYILAKPGPADAAD